MRLIIDSYEFDFTVTDSPVPGIDHKLRKDSIENIRKTFEPLPDWIDSVCLFLEEWNNDSVDVKLQTSGSTGIPKVIILPKKSLWNSARMTNAFFNLDQNSLSLMCLPAHYIAGKMMLVRAIAGNYTLEIREPSGNPFQEKIHLPFQSQHPNYPLQTQSNQDPLKYEIQDVSLLSQHPNNPLQTQSKQDPMQNQTLLALHYSNRPVSTSGFVYDFTAITPFQLLQSGNDLKIFPVRNVIVGGSPVTLQIENMISEWPQNFYETFGMTETASHIALRKLNNFDSSQDNITPLTALKDIVPEDNASLNIQKYNASEVKTDQKAFRTLSGVEIGQDEQGCLTISAPQLCPEKLITNDLVDIIDSVHFRWLGRRDRVINSGGVKIFPEKTERILQQFITGPFFVSSLPDDLLGNKVILVIEGPEIPSVEMQSLKQFVLVSLDKYQQPREILFIPEFVRSAGNKILQKETLLKIH